VGLKKGSTGKPLLAILGFLGRGNVGDEAIVQCIYEAFREKFDFVFVVDEHGAKSGWWDWYPYNESERIHQGNIHFFENRIAGLLVGGGGLGLGYGASQAIVARWAGTPTALAGTDHTHTVDISQAGMEASRRYLELFDYVALRSSVSVEWAGRDGVTVERGSDWALNLVTDRYPDIPYSKTRASVVIREFPEHMLDDRYIQEAVKLIKGLRDYSYEPLLLPLSPEDVSFANSAGLSNIADQEVHWWNARRVQQWIEESRLLVSVGRLHSMIFAANVGTANIQVRPAVRTGVLDWHFRKLEVMAQELSVPYALSVSDALKMVSGPLETAQMKIAAKQCRSHLSTMIQKLGELFSRR